MTMKLSDHGELRGRAYTMTEEASRRWGAHEGEGVEAEDMGAFRRALRREIGAEADRLGHSVEVFAAMRDAQDWIVDVIEPRADDNARR